MTQKFEFLGPYLGPCLIMPSLPIVGFYLYATCTQYACQLAPSLASMQQTMRQVDLVAGFKLFIGWVAVVVVLHQRLPGLYRWGTKLSNGTQLHYKLNGMRVLLTILVGACLLHYVDRFDLTMFYDHYLSMMAASTVFSYALSVYLFVSSFRPRKLLSPHGSTGYFVYDFFMGRELNPRVGGLDLKEFCELYPGLILWVILNVSMALKQQQRLGYVTAPMIIVNLFQFIYVADAMLHEPSILTTMDITTEGFGFMLAFGDLTWVPFTYTLQARYLADHPQSLSLPYLLLVVALNVAGYAVFRGSNSQKDIFRKDPNDKRVAHLRTISTERGRKLLVSGWWGVARHINYTGDWMMAVAWSLLCGTGSLVPYFYPVYFAVLLVHRDWRDFEACKQKYGKDWDRYCEAVRYSLIPYFY